MAISGSILDEEKAQRMMEQLGILNLPDPQAKVGYVTKDINKDFNEYHLNQLKNVIQSQNQLILMMRYLNQTLLVKLVNGKLLP